MTALSTAATGAFALLTAAAAIVGLRRDTKNQRPVVELALSWSRERFYLNARVTVRNRLFETIDVTRAEVQQPKGAKISRVNLMGGAPSGPDPAASDFVDFAFRVPPLGTQPTQFQAGDVLSIDLHVFPPEGWRGGDVRINLWISSRALTIRDKRITTTSVIAAPPVQQSDDKTKSQSPPIPQ